MLTLDPGLESEVRDFCVLLPNYIIFFAQSLLQLWKSGLIPRSTILAKYHRYLLLEEIVNPLVGLNYKSSLVLNLSQLGLRLLLKLKQGVLGNMGA